MNNEEHIKQIVEKLKSKTSHVIEKDLVHAAMGMSTEAAEILTVIKAKMFYNREMDELNLLEELGDLRFFYNLFISAMGWTDEQVLDANAAKLRQRYSEGKFSDKQANERDLAAENSQMITSMKENKND